MSKKPKTEGLEWLIHSLMAFNGTGYADMTDAEAFLASYIAYKSMRRKSQAVGLAQRHKQDVLPTIEALLARTYGPGRAPTEKNRKKFEAFRNAHQSRLL
jgi:hypothetical protein